MLAFKFAKIQGKFEIYPIFTSRFCKRFLLKGDTTLFPIIDFIE